MRHGVGDFNFSLHLLEADMTAWSVSPAAQSEEGTDRNLSGFPRESLRFTLNNVAGDTGGAIKSTWTLELGPFRIHCSHMHFTVM